MYLAILYQKSKYIVIPEVLLEFVPGLEETLLFSLKEIDLIAKSDDFEHIINCVRRNQYTILGCFYVTKGYVELSNVLFHTNCYSSIVYNNLDDFMAHSKYPVIMNPRCHKRFVIN